MNPERWQQVKRLLDGAIALDEAERGPYLDWACAADFELRSEVESLLSSHERAGTGFLKSPSLNLNREAQSAPVRTGRRIGVYQIVEEIGRGGMGEVYRGVRADGQYTKEVAVKLVRGGFDSAFVLERFRTERQILATLDHPNIARLLDGGTTEDGIPYLVMELIEGVRIDLFCDERRLSITQRLQLFRQVCAAVQYAHQRLVIHRDIKPGNILVTKEGVPKLLDFGIAKILDPATGAEATMVRPMTPEYASPEQIRGEPITTASDVYSLGVVLYQLLTGRSPYAGETSNSHELARAVCETDPGRPSVVVLKPRAARAGEAVEELTPEQVSKAREGSPAKLHRRLAGDLDNIVLRALRKEPQRRYASAEQFAEDIWRHLEGRPVAASKGSWNYRAKKFVTRNRAGVAAGAAVLLVLLGGIAATTRQARIARAERARAENRLNDVRRLSDSLIFDINDAIQNLPGATPARKLLLDRAVQYLDSVSKDAAGNPDLQRELAYGYQRLAAVLGDPTQSNLGEEKEAERNIRKALALFEEVANANPRDTTDQLNVAAMHRVLSFSSLMEPSGQRNLEQAVAISERLMKTDGANPKVKNERSIELQNVGLMQDGLGNRAQAVESLRKNLEIKQDILATSPNFSRVRMLVSVGVASVLLGNELVRVGSRSEAVAQIESGIALFETLTKDKADLDIARRMAIAKMKRGDIQMMEGDMAGARESFRAARSTLDPMATADPQNSMLRLDIAGLNYEEGRILAATGHFAEAEARLRLAGRIFEQLHAPDRTTDEIPHGLGAIYIWQGEALAGMRNFNGALESYQKAEAALEAPPDHGLHNDSRCELVVSFTKIGDVFTKMGRLEQASAAYKKAVERIGPSSPTEYQNVPALYAAAAAYRGLGDVALARARHNADTSSGSVLLGEARESYESRLNAWKQIPNPSHISPLGYLADDPRLSAPRLPLTAPRKADN